MRASSSTRRAILRLASIFGLLFSLQLSGSAHAQQGHGLLVVENWPDEETKRTGRFEILPFVDTLSVAYRYREVERRPELSLVLEWKAAREAIYEGRRVAFEKIAGHPALVGLELTADVFSGGSRVAEFALVVDSMIVEASPDIIRIDLPHLEWANVFVNTPADVAREIFSAGFELRNPTVLSAGFALFEEGRQIADTAVEKRPEGEGSRPPHVGPRRPRNVSIYRHPGFIDIGFDLFWLIGSGRRGVRIADNDGPRENIGRGSLGGSLGGSRRDRSGRDGGDVDRGPGGSSPPEQVGGDEDGRLARGRRAGSAEGERDETTDREGSEESDRSESGRSKSKFPGFGSGDDDDDDDDEDDPNLVPYAIAAVAAAGVLAAVGGTIGYYGSTRYAPLGVTSGIVRDEGGLLLQVGVNEALLAGDDGPKRLMGRVLSFGNLFRSPTIQPALGVGVLATSDAGTIEYEPSVSVGGVVRHNVLLFYAGYDVVQNGPEFSLAFDLRQLWRKSR